MIQTHIKSLICTVLLGAGVLWFGQYHENTKRTNIHYNTAEVVSLGQCSESKCSFMYKTQSGEVRNGLSREPVSIGQLVYQECWEEKVRGSRCYVEYEPNM
ncbi:Uncharacterised protein [Escherichia coli]|uniref:Uncharacterized protein n=2 Tax=Asteriusvirus TaxID=2560094 RepID=A0A097EY58_9CAUD|nr:membrane protein [Escherichia phage 121Q]QXN76196.1 hypothetical protein [Escherichia phage BF17]WIL00730.1 hypothetical protein [Escherichia phage vB_EcoM_CRJP21]WPK18281.1 hypothetical protein [Salmonella phage SD-2_S15]WPK18932.1 hypothetical protein [Salmonella phage SD-6_S16]WPK19604.1 hypothetical protein [Salmonella phage SD-1_S14]WPK20626.1 hypothetical protein [Salmonella phage SD-15_S21]VVZ29188.1 Uncharacterised protein [Escherichia coli]